MKTRYFAIVDRRGNQVISVGDSRTEFKPIEFIEGVARFIEVEINEQLANEFQEAFNSGRAFCMEDRI